MSKIKEIIRLSEEAKISERQIAKALGVARKTVAHYLACYRKSGLSCLDLNNLRESEVKARLCASKEREPIKRYAQLEELFEHFEKELKRTGVTRELLWREYIEKYPDGYGYSQFCYHFQQWKDNSELSMVMEHKAGDKMFVDYTGKKLQITDRTTLEKRDVEVFVSILGASQLIYVEASVNQQKESFITSNENAFWYYGGVTQAIVPDCLKSGVLKANKYEPEINPEYARFAQHYQTVILPARPASPKDKALVENAVRNVYTSIFAPLRDHAFFSLEDLNLAVREKLEILNNRNFQRMKTSRRDLFLEVEQKALKSLPISKYEMFKHIKVKVQFNYHAEIREDYHYYSVPWQYKGKYVDIRYNKNTVEIYCDNERIAIHERSLKGKYSTKPEHMPQSHKHYADWSPQRFKKWAITMGGHVLTVIEQILDNCAHPEQGFKVALGILSLEKQYDKERLNQACKKSLEWGECSYKRIKGILDKGIDLIKEEVLFDTPLPNHKNTRGKTYYQ